MSTLDALDVGQGIMPEVGKPPSDAFAPETNVNALGQGQIASKDYITHMPPGYSNEDGLEPALTPTQVETPAAVETQGLMGGRFKSQVELESYVQEMELRELERTQSSLSNEGYRSIHDLGIPQEQLPELDNFIRSIGGGNNFDEAYQVYQDGLKYRASQVDGRVKQAQDKMFAILKGEFGSEYDTYMPKIAERIASTDKDKNSLKGARELFALIKYEEMRSGNTPQGTQTQVPVARSMGSTNSAQVMLSEKDIFELLTNDRDRYDRLLPQIHKAYEEGRVIRDLRR